MRGAVERELMALGLFVRDTVPYHWMIETQWARRVLDYWPGTGTWMRHDTKERGAVPCAEDLPALLQGILGSFPSEV